MNMQQRLRQNVDARWIPKQEKYQRKLLKKLERLSKRGIYSYEIVPCYMPRWFKDGNYSYNLMKDLQLLGFKIELNSRRHELGTLYSVINISW